ncbi:unnamed protein product [Polarella glacialis]|uniref:RapZ C-terminal domain-containing protein n=1 Tax=Polarella glacialis TaxID=89957 RepID=A0A813LRM4_POLGL|nr:unnamed protein product [Polarella glacialis]
MDLRPLAKGEVATVVQDSSEHEGVAGYLIARKGESVEVLHVGEVGTDEAGWIYVRREGSNSSVLEAWTEQSDRGWLRALRVVTESQVQLRKGVTVIARRTVERREGYLSCEDGDRLKVLYCGSRETNDDEWLWAQGEGGQSGWLSKGSVTVLQKNREKGCAAQDLGGQTSSSTGQTRSYGRILRTCSLSRTISPNATESERTYLLAHAGETSTPLHANREVEIVQTRGSWVQVRLGSETAGWVQAEHVSQDSLSPPPPPAAETTRLVPPKPQRPAPRPPGQKEAQTQASAAAASASRPPEPVPEDGGHTGLQWLQWQEGHSRTAGTSSTWLADGNAGAFAGQFLGAPGSTREAFTRSDLAPSGPCGSRLPSLRGEVVVVTFGLENCDSRLVDRCCDSAGGGGGFVQVEEGELRAALCRRSVPDADVILDARMFPDPDACHLTKHSGRHHLIISRICQHRNFRKWLTEAKRRFMKACDSRLAKLGMDCMDSSSDGIQVTVATYCRAGKHRSVATAGILTYIFREEGFLCGETRHLSYKAWGKNCCKGNCQECQHPPDELEVTLENALQLWRQIS